MYALRLGAVLLASTMLSSVSGIALSEANAQSASERQYQFNIGAQPVAQALNVIGRTTGLSVVVNGRIPSVSAQPVAGNLTARQAISAVLSGTGLTYSFTNGNTVTVFDPSAGAQTGNYGDSGSIQLETIDVSAGGKTGWAAAADTPFQTAGSSNFISGESISRFPGTTTGDMFKSTPGVISGSNRNGASIDPNIRGMQGMNRIATSIDGAEQATSTYRGYNGVDNRTYVDPDFIGGISISKGPSDGAQGASAIGGSVSMETLNASDVLKDGKNFGVRVRGSLGDNSIAPVVSRTVENTGDTSLFDFENGAGSIAMAAASDNVEVVAGFVRRKSGNYFAGNHGNKTYEDHNGVEQPISLYTDYGEEVFNTSEDVTSSLVKATWDFGDGHRLRTSYIHYENTFGEAMPSVINNGYRELTPSSVDTDTLTMRYEWNPSFTDLIDFRLNSWFTDIDENSRLTDLISDTPRATNSHVAGVNLSNTSRLETAFGAFAISYGGSYSQEMTEPDEVIAGVYILSGERRTASAFARTEWEPWDWLKLEGGVQYLNYESEDTSGWAGTTSRPAFTGYSGEKLSPNYGITITPLDGWQVFAKYSSGYRPPSIRESTWSESGLRFNPNLRPEQASNWEFGSNYLADNVITEGDKLKLKVAYFDNNYEDYIGRRQEFLMPFWIPYFEVYNLDSVQMKGIEFNANYDTGKYFAELGLNYYTDYEFCVTAANCAGGTDANDYALNQIPPEFAATVVLGARFFDEKLTIGGRYSYVGDRIFPFNSTTRTTPWAPYQLVDTFATWEFAEDVTLGVTADNVFDRYYADALANARAPSPGRTIRASLTAKF
jgi:hemoglobin/transferrin/lactoferrin receptor protein